jgi:hypothetical protein
MDASGTESDAARNRQPIALRVLAAWPVLTPVVAFLVAEIVQVVEHGVTGFHRATLLNGLVYLVGVTGIIAASGHLLKPDDVARSIGWAPGSPFQWEVGVAGLGFGVLGVMSPAYGRGFWLATIVMASIFLIGAAVGHVKQMVVAKNFAPGNAGGIFVADVFVPVFLIVLYLTYHGPA